MFPLLLLLAPPDPTAEAKLLPVERRWPAVVATYRVTAGIDPGPLGTAVCVGQEGGHAYLLTAAHVVPKGEAREFERFDRATYPLPKASLIGGEVVLYLPDADVALVKVFVGKELVPTVKLARPGQRPKVFPFEAVGIGCPAGEPPIARAERISGKAAARRPNGGLAFFWTTERAPMGGMSGGPVLDAEGRVIGICGAAAGGTGYYAHLDEILAGLKKAGFGWLYDPVPVAELER